MDAVLLGQIGRGLEVFDPSEGKVGSAGVAEVEHDLGEHRQRAHFEAGRTAVGEHRDGLPQRCLMLVVLALGVT